MISKDEYLHFVKRFITNGFIKPDLVNVDLGQLSPMEQGFIYSISKETLASKTILEGIQFDDLTLLEKHMYFDSRVLNFLSSNPSSDQYIRNQEFLRIVEEALEFDPESLIGLFMQVHQAIYKKEYKEAIQLLERLKKKISLTDKLTYLLIMYHFYLKDIRKSKSELQNLNPSLQKLFISFVLFYYGSIVYRLISGLILMIIFIIFNPIWLPIMVVFILNILVISVGFFYRNNMIISLGVADTLSIVIIAGLSFFTRYLISTI